MEIQIWTDFACPFCYIGEARLMRVLRSMGKMDDVTFTMRSFELYPMAREPMVMTAERLAEKYAIKVDSAKRHIAKMTSAAQEEGLEFHYDTVISVCTFDAHRFAKYATSEGHPEVWDRLFKAYFTDNLNLADHAVLARLGEEIGLSGSDTLAMLSTDRYAKDVQEDEALAAYMGISGVPLFDLDGFNMINGAQPAEYMEETLRYAFKMNMKRQSTSPHAFMCGPDGCALH